MQGQPPPPRGSRGGIGLSPLAAILFGLIDVAYVIAYITSDPRTSEKGQQLIAIGIFTVLAALCGFQWRRRLRLRNAAPPPVMPLGCQICGRSPITYVTIRDHTGMVMMMRSRRWRGWFCRDCGLRLYHEKQHHTMLFGWWGVVSFFAGTPMALIANLGAKRALEKLPPATNQP